MATLGGKACDSVVWKGSQEQKDERALLISLAWHVKIFALYIRIMISQTFYMDLHDQVERKGKMLRKSCWLATQARLLKISICVSTFQGLIFDFAVSETDFHQHENYGLFFG